MNNMPATKLPARRQSTELDTSLSARWKPTGKQEAYLRACLDPEVDRTVKARCAAAGICRQAFYKWLQVPEFNAWLSTQRRLAWQHELPDIKQRGTELAKQGSPEHIRICLELAGELGRGHMLGNTQIGISTVFVNIPRPPADDKDTLDIGPPVLPLVLNGERH
jgi:hypothetical protein